MESPLQKCIDFCLARNGKFFSASQVSAKTGLSLKDVNRRLRKLAREGHLTRYQEMNGEPTHSKGRPELDVVYRPLASLKERKAGRENTKHRDTDWDRMWRAIRVLKRFQRKDIVATAAVKEENARFFLKMLKRAGYLRTSRPRGPGVEWRLVHDPGPDRPSWAEMKRRESENEKEI